MREFERKYCKRKEFNKYFKIDKGFVLINKQRHELE